MLDTILIILLILWLLGYFVLSVGSLVHVLLVVALVVLILRIWNSRKSPL